MSPSTVKQSYTRALEKFFALPQRDQLALKLLAAFLGGLLLIYGLWLPTQQQHREAQDYWHQQRELLSWLQAQQSLIPGEAQQAGPHPENQQPLLTRVTNSAKQQGLPLKRLQPEGENLLRLWLENVSFNQSLKWLEQLQRHHSLEIRDIAIETRREKSGMVNIRLVLVE